MSTIIFWGAIFIISLFVLIKASDFFTDAAEAIGLFLKLPSFIIGVTIVALGTSLPELTSSILAVSEGYPEIVSGNVVGSNITNIFLILGVVSFVTTRNILKHNILRVDLPILLGSTFLIGVSMIDGEFSFWEGVLCLVGLLVFFYHSKSSERGGKKGEQELSKDVKEETGLKFIKRFPYKSLGILIVSSVFIFVGAKYTVDSVVEISSLLKVGTEIIAATVVALGTSLPELAVSYSAARKGNLEIALGNILGSNIFNALAVMGITSMVGTLIIPESVLYFGLPVMIIATFMYVFITQDKELTKWEGSFLLIFYVFYIGKLFGLI